MRYFDYETVARDAAIPSDKLDQLVKRCFREEPRDPMLAELHILRACMAIKNGKLTIADALNEGHMLAA